MQLKGLLLCLLAVPATVHSAGVPLWLAGADEGQLAAVTEVWPEAEVLPPGLFPDSPYPDLLSLLENGGMALMVAFDAGPAGLAVSGRLIARGGYDEDLGTVHTAAEESSLLEAISQFRDRVAEIITPVSDTSPEETITLSVGKIIEKLSGLSGWGVAHADGATTDERRRLARRRAYDAAEVDFLDRLEETFYPKVLLDALSYKQVVALVRGYLFVSREELRPGDETYGVALRLTPEGIRLLAGLLFTKLSSR